MRRYLASGAIQRHVTACYKISKQHFGVILLNVCDAIIKNLKFVMPALDTQHFVKTSEGFDERWNFPNCVGAIDDKHCAIKAPKNSGSLFHNYKVSTTFVVL